MPVTERALQLAGLNALFSGTRLTLLYNEQVPGISRPNSDYEIGRTISYLEQARSGLLNKRTWEKEGRFALTRDYVDQDSAYQSLRSVLPESEEIAEQELSDHIATLCAVAKRTTIESDRIKKVVGFLGAVSSQFRQIVSMEADTPLAGSIS